MERLPMLSAPPCRRRGIILKVFALLRHVRLQARPASKLCAHDTYTDSHTAEHQQALCSVRTRDFTRDFTSLP